MGGSMFDSCSFTHQFKLNFLETESVATGHSVSSEVISAGGHLWRINCHPRRPVYRNSKICEYVLCVSLQHMSESKQTAKAIFEAFVMNKDGTPSPSHSYKVERVFAPNSKDRGACMAWPCYVERSVLESRYLTNGFFTVMCGVKVVQDEEEEDPMKLQLPPSDIGRHLGLLLDTAEGSDVAFVVDGETFPAHRAVLAARSPVFKAQLLGSMADAKMASITLHDIAPATFRAMLRFMYTDDSPEDAELGGDSLPDDMFRCLLAAADRFALDRLKILCAVKLWETMSVETVVASLICAETYSCPQLKKKCIGFIAEEKNFRKVMLRDGFLQLVQRFPSILDELRDKVGALA